MKIYKWTGTGQHLFAVIICSAESITQAEEVIGNQLVAAGLMKVGGEVYGIEEILIEEPSVIYFDEGL